MVLYVWIMVKWSEDIQVHFFQFHIRFVCPVQKQISGSLVGRVGTRAHPPDGDFRLQLLEDFIDH